MITASLLAQYDIVFFYFLKSSGYGAGYGTGGYDGYYGSGGYYGGGGDYYSQYGYSDYTGYDYDAATPARGGGARGGRGNFCFVPLLLRNALV